MRALVVGRMVKSLLKVFGEILLRPIAQQVVFASSEAAEKLDPRSALALVFFAVARLNRRLGGDLPGAGDFDNVFHRLYYFGVLPIAVEAHGCGQVAGAKDHGIYPLIDQ